MKPVHLRTVPPPQETFQHTELFKLIFQFMKPYSYLELGVRWGGNLKELAPYCKQAVGVDFAYSLVTESMPDNVKYFNMSTDDFFKTLEKGVMFDAVFIDADHSFEQSLKDFENVKDRVIEDGLIFFHDTYPSSEEYINPNQCGDVYKTALYIKQNYIDEFEIMTLPFNPGVTIIKKMKRNKQLYYRDEK